MEPNACIRCMNMSLHEIPHCPKAYNDIQLITDTMPSLDGRI